MLQHASSIIQLLGQQLVLNLACSPTIHPSIFTTGTYNKALRMVNEHSKEREFLQAGCRVIANWSCNKDRFPKGIDLVSVTFLPFFRLLATTNNYLFTLNAGSPPCSLPTHQPPFPEPQKGRRALSMHFSLREGRFLSPQKAPGAYLRCISPCAKVAS